MDCELKRIAVLGSTGSIGQQTLEVARAFPEKLQVVALAARRKSPLFEQQVQQFQPELVLVEGQGPSLEEIAGHQIVDLVMVATSGKAGLLPTLTAIRAGKVVALANKEALVMAGEIVMSEARRCRAEIRPVDSEHSAIWQCLQGEETNPISQIILTASGGPFRGRSHEELGGITAEQALRHPTWKMGRKVTIDSATLMNKGMEVIEGHWLFSVHYDRIKVMIHPGSIIHSMVEFLDGSVKAQLGAPDMHLPIQYALSYPERWANPWIPELNLEKIDSLELERVDMENFPCLKLAVEAGAAGDTYPAVLCAADEVAVELFLSGMIGFLDIPRLIEGTIGRHRPVSNPSLEEILAADLWARETAKEWVV
jgi:1-deoxy-D-xylulose-5-phosphate reductoisomerase